MNMYKNNSQSARSYVPAEDFSLNFEEIKHTYAHDKHDKWIPILSW